MQVNWELKIIAGSTFGALSIAIAVASDAGI